MKSKIKNQLELELYFEHGCAKLRYKKPHTRYIIPDNLPESVAPAHKKCN